MKGLLAPQNTFLDTIATRFDGTRKFSFNYFIAFPTTCLPFLRFVLRLKTLESRIPLHEIRNYIYIKNLIHLKRYLPFVYFNKINSLAFILGLSQQKQRFLSVES